ncbi:hypothetical protein CYMTET_19623 [Cymbomonas tetramitiformis]|uniref:Uncharacterized protein n=1 Tax=Cymbomonas tetramitiformis TaxID=36881 RepID=A0AAE0L4S7_9CHLO|nr:hypothetical protein CYMTET_19623 [Cymbomonas tetramitiformis]
MPNDRPPPTRQGEARRHRGATHMHTAEDATRSSVRKRMSGKPMFKPVPLFEGVVLANSPVDTVKHGQCEMPLSEDHLSLVVKQWHWTVTHKDTVMAHVKKVLMAIFKPIEKLGGKNIKDADRMGKMLAEKILCGQCPSGINLV